MATGEGEGCVVKSVLTAWGLQDLYSIFVANGIDEEIFFLLDAKDVERLLPEPQFNFGFRFKFMKKYNDFKSVALVNLEDPSLVNNVNMIESNDVIIQAPKNLSPSAEGTMTIPLCEGSVAQDSTFIPSDQGSPTLLATLSDEDYHPELDNVLQPFLKCKKVLGESSSDDDQPLIRMQTTKRALKQGTRSDSNQPPVKKPLVNANILTRRKINAFSSSKELNDMDLENLLSQGLEGRAVLNAYKTNSCLEEDDRASLVDIIVKWLLFRNTSPKRSDYDVLKTKVLHLFPNEENAYYIAPKDEGPLQTLARGKLFDRTKNVKDWMRRKGLLPPVQTDKKYPKKSVNAQPVASVEMTENIRLALEWLHNFREPWTKVQEKWALTSNYRISQLMNGSMEKLADYLNEYKVLRQRLGYTLIEEDFRAIHPEKQDALLMNWAVFREKVRKIISTTQIIKDPEGKVFAQALASSREGPDGRDSTNILLLLLLPSLLPPSKVVRCGKKTIKPSIKESRESFICHVKIPAQVQPMIVQKKEKVFNEYGSSATVQPYIMYVGQEFSDVEAVYVIIDNFAYKLETVIQALDVCFKCFFALDVQYPVQSDHVWLLIQKAIFQISTNKDPNILKVTSFLKRLEVMGNES